MSREYGSPVWGTVREEHPLVTVKQGTVRGFSREGIAIFKGIPYGGPCEGSARFQAPVPAAGWDGERDCTKNGCYAMQNGQSIGGDPGPLADYYRGADKNSLGELEQQGENCLDLDVLTPGIDDSKRPVVFYIHGGGFSTGSGTMVAAADAFCREQDIVVVGVNHRLNIFGYLWLGDLDENYRASGCAGMLDLVLALEWVRDNIASFGGDPDNVTLMGESGGGAKINLLMTMPSARGLFKKAIVESGSLATGHLTPAKAGEVTARVLENLGLSKDNWKEILTLPAQALLDAASKERDFGALTPVADGKYIPFQTGSGFEYGIPDYSYDVPVMVGAGEDELGLFAQPDPSLTWENLPDILTRDGIHGPDSSAELTRDDAAALVDLFRSVNVKNDDVRHTWIKMVSMISNISRAGFYQALERVSSDRFTAPVYHYINAYDSAHPMDLTNACSWHTSDLPLQMRIVQRPQDEEISTVMSAAWASFMRNGSPSTDALPWKPFTPADRNVMIFDNDGKTRMETDPHKVLREAIEKLTN